MNAADVSCTHLATIASTRASNRRAQAARTACAWAGDGCTCACACSAATSAVATTPPTATPPPTGTSTQHPIIRSYEPGEDWWWCYPDDLFFEIDDAPPAPSHP